VASRVHQNETDSEADAADDSDAVAPSTPTVMRPRRTSSAPNLRPAPPKRSVKHMTCAFWANGHCHKTEAQCLYAHHHTNKIADKPVAVERGGRALAGRNLESALRQRGSGESTPERASSRQNWRTPSTQTEVEDEPKITHTDVREEIKGNQQEIGGTQDIEGAAEASEIPGSPGTLIETPHGTSAMHMQLEDLQTSINHLTTSIEAIFAHERDARPALRFVPREYSREAYQQALQLAQNYITDLRLVQVPKMTEQLQDSLESTFPVLAAHAVAPEVVNAGEGPVHILTTESANSVLAVQNDGK